MAKTFIINGYQFHDIPSFYEEINRVFMCDENWQLRQSLDALDDMLYGNYGAIKGNEPIVIIWKNFEQNRIDFGVDFTRNYYQQKLNHPEKFNVNFIEKQLKEMERGNGKTYFEIILEIFSSHPNIELIIE